MYETKPEITKEFILSRVSEEEIFQRYLGIYPKVTDDFKNFLRADKQEGCRFYRDTRGVLKFKDFSKGWNWDCFNVVQRVESCSFVEALRIIAVDFQLITSSGIDRNVKFSHNPDTLDKAVIRGKTEIQIKAQPWTTTDIKYWKSYGLDSETLKRYQVYSVQRLWIGGKLRGQYSHSDPIYAYYFGNGDYKIYFPFRSKGGYGRFRQNNFDILQGYNQLPEEGDYLIITKSLKDVMCLSVFSIPAVAPMAESKLVDHTEISNLLYRFDSLYSLMDWDNAGITMAVKMRMEYDIPALMFGAEYAEDGIKDFADHIKQRGIQETIDLVEYVKKEEGF